jgi:hypothetical protein
MKVLDEINPPKLKNQKTNISPDLFCFVLSSEIQQFWDASGSSGKDLPSRYRRWY